jgi:hypothetical protein
VRRSPVLCGVRVFVTLCMYLIEEANKEEELVDISLG